MYNTLNAIKCYAMIHNEKKIATVIGDFVELLQTCIRKKGTFLTVAEEIQVLKNYIHLQEFRNGEEYQAAYAIERESRAMSDTKTDLTAPCRKCVDSWTGSEK